MSRFVYAVRRALEDDRCPDCGNPLVWIRPLATYDIQIACHACKRTVTLADTSVHDLVRDEGAPQAVRLMSLPSFARLVTYLWMLEGAT